MSVFELRSGCADQEKAFIAKVSDRKTRPRSRVTTRSVDEILTFDSGTYLNNIVFIAETQCRVDEGKGYWRAF